MTCHSVHLPCSPSCNANSSEEKTLSGPSSYSFVHRVFAMERGPELHLSLLICTHYAFCIGSNMCIDQSTLRCNSDIVITMILLLQWLEYHHQLNLQYYQQRSSAGSGHGFPSLHGWYAGATAGQGAMPNARQCAKGLCLIALAMPTKTRRNPPIASNSQLPLPLCWFSSSNFRNCSACFYHSARKRQVPLKVFKRGRPNRVSRNPDTVSNHLAPSDMSKWLLNGNILLPMLWL